MQAAFWIRLLGLSGGLVATAGALIAGMAYSGTAGERYSPFNHFISELGEVGVSRLAWVFNAALILTGLLLAACCAMMGLTIPGWLSKVAMAVGIAASIFLSLVGVFPMGNLKPHIFVAMTYFRLGLVTALLFTIAIAAQGSAAPMIPHAAAFASIPAVIAYAAFLIYGSVTSRGTGQSGLEATFANRPRLWTLSILEWLIFLTTVLWFSGIALAL